MEEFKSSQTFALISNDQKNSFDHLEMVRFTPESIGKVCGETTIECS